MAPTRKCHMSLHAPRGIVSIVALCDEFFVARYVIAGAKSMIVTDAAEAKKKIDMGGLFSIDWAEIESMRLRFVPPPNADVSIAGCGVMFGHLNLLKETGVLRTWTFIVEEAYRFVVDSNLRAPFIESRKSLRKLVLVSSDYKPRRAWL